MGIMDSIGGALFGKSGSVRNENLDANQVEARNRQIQALGGAVDNSGQALAGYTGEAYNPYDEAQGTEQFGRMRSFLGQDRNRQMSSLRGGPMNRFSTASAKLGGDIESNYARNMLGTDQADLLAQTNAKQQAYQNRMNAIQQALGGNQAMLSNSGQTQNTKSTGLMDVLGGAGQALGAVRNIFGGTGGN